MTVIKFPYKMNQLLFWDIYFFGLSLNSTEIYILQLGKDLKRVKAKN